MRGTREIPRLAYIPILAVIVVIGYMLFDQSTINVRGVVYPLNEWSLMVEGDGAVERTEKCGSIHAVRRWQGRRGEPVVVQAMPGIAPGMKVTQGQTMASLCFPMETYQYATALACLETAKAELRHLEAAPREEEVLVARSEVSRAELTDSQLATAEARASSLFARELLSDEAYELARFELGMAREETKSTRAMLAMLLAGPTMEEREALQAEIASLEAELAAAAARAETTLIVSPIHGMVASPMEGYLVAVQQTDTVVVHMPVDQAVSREISLGVEVEIKASGGIQAQGQVISIGQSATVVGNKVAVIVQAALPNPNGQLKPGMTVDARIARNSS